MVWNVGQAVPLEHRAAEYRRLAASVEVRELERMFRAESDRWLRKLIAAGIARRFPQHRTSEHDEYLKLDVRTSL